MATDAHTTNRDVTVEEVRHKGELGDDPVAQAVHIWHIDAVGGRSHHQSRGAGQRAACLRAAAVRRLGSQISLA